MRLDARSASWVAVALVTVAWPGGARAETDALALAGGPLSSTPTSSDESPVPFPLFTVLTLGGELGANYAGGGKLALLANPTSSGISVGGSVFAAPVTNFIGTCAPSCSLNPLVLRFMAELRLGTAYRIDAKSLGWLGLSAGVEYFEEPNLYPSPALAVAAGGDVRLSGAFWLEVSLRLTGAEMIGPESSFAGPYFTFGLDIGTRIDLTR